MASSPKKGFHELVKQHYSEFDQYIGETATPPRYWRLAERLRFYWDVAEYKERWKKASFGLEKLCFELVEEFLGNKDGIYKIRISVTPEILGGNGTSPPGRQHAGLGVPFAEFQDTFEEVEIIEGMLVC